MMRWSLFLVLLAGLAGVGTAQVEKMPSSNKAPAQNQAPPRDDEPRRAGVSSSHDTRIDITPPKDDAKAHPNNADAEGPADDSDVQEMHPWNPHRAMKDIEVGDFYFRQKNYRAALSRYQEALEYKPNDALANFHMAECFEKLHESDDAIMLYQKYLKILPNGPHSKEAEKAIQKLEGEKSQASQNGPQP